MVPGAADSHRAAVHPGAPLRAQPGRSLVREDRQGLEGQRGGGAQDGEGVDATVRHQELSGDEGGGCGLRVS